MIVYIEHSRAAMGNRFPTPVTQTILESSNFSFLATTTEYKWGGCKWLPNSQWLSFISQYSLSSDPVGSPETAESSMCDSNSNSLYIFLLCREKKPIHESISCRMQNRWYSLILKGRYIIYERFIGEGNLMNRFSYCDRSTSTIDHHFLPKLRVQT